MKYSMEKYKGRYTIKENEDEYTREKNEWKYYTRRRIERVHKELSKLQESV